MTDRVENSQIADFQAEIFVIGEKN